MATDDSGDFVDVYTRTDADAQSRRHAGARPVRQPDVPARTSTPATTPTPCSGSRCLPRARSKFSLVYGGNAVEEISFSQATPTLAGTALAAPISGTFSLWFDTNGNGIQDPGEVTAPINFYEVAYNSGDPNFDPAMADAGRLAQAWAAPWPT